MRKPVTPVPGLTTWCRWPGAELEQTDVLHTVTERGQVVSEQLTRSWRIVRGKRKPREYAFAEQQACWRNFAETLIKGAVEQCQGRPDAFISSPDAFDPHRLLAFARRYGVPHYADAPSETFGNVHLAVLLHEISRWWTDNAEHSVFTERDVPPGTLTLLQLQLQQPELNLGGMMLGAASRHLVDRTPMRRCDTCHNWMAVGRSTRQFCSSTCRGLGEG